MGTQQFMECQTCVGGTNPRYDLTPCPSCWGAQKMPQLPSATRKEMVRLYQWLATGVTTLVRQRRPGHDLGEPGSADGATSVCDRRKRRLSKKRSGHAGRHRGL